MGLICSYQQRRLKTIIELKELYIAQRKIIEQYDKELKEYTQINFILTTELKDSIRLTEIIHENNKKINNMLLNSPEFKSDNYIKPIKTSLV